MHAALLSMWGAGGNRLRGLCRAREFQIIAAKTELHLDVLGEKVRKLIRKLRIGHVWSWR